MSKKTRHMDTTRGYSRAAHKAVTMAVVDEDYYEEMLEDQHSGDAGNRASKENQSREAQAGAAPATQNEQPEPARNGRHRLESPAGTEVSTEDRPKKKRGFLNRMFGALRGLG